MLISKRVFIFALAVVPAVPASGLMIGSDVADASAHPHARRSPPQFGDARVGRGQQSKLARVALLLRTPSLRVTASTHQDLTPVPNASMRKSLRRAPAASVRSYAEVQAVRRNQALRHLRPRARVVATVALPVQQAIHRLGGTILSSSVAGGTVIALVPRFALASLAERRDVRLIMPALRMPRLNLGVES